MFSALSIFTGPYALLAKWGVIVALALACMGFGAVKMHQHDQKKYDALETQFETFKAKTAALGEAAITAAKAKAAADKLKQETTDVEHEKIVLKLTADIKRMRADADSARGSYVPPAPAASSRPELACFDRGALESAIGELVTEVRAGADEGTTETIDLDTAKRWVKP
jgi:hypothetical protein